jgi:hypothetical protein
MRKFSTVLLAASALGLAAAPTAFTAPADEAPVGTIGQPGVHYHHIHTGNGECRDINSVGFEHDDRGLHQGASQSGSEEGPWHGTCANHRPHPPS